MVSLFPAMAPYWSIVVPKVVVTVWKPILPSPWQSVQSGACGKLSVCWTTPGNGGLASAVPAVVAAATASTHPMEREPDITSQIEV